jgi:hypothetical protein
MKSMVYAGDLQLFLTTKEEREMSILQAHMILPFNDTKESLRV